MSNSKMPVVVLWIGFVSLLTGTIACFILLLVQLPVMDDVDLDVYRGYLMPFSPVFIIGVLFNGVLTSQMMCDLADRYLVK